MFFVKAELRKFGEVRSHPPWLRHWTFQHTLGSSPPFLFRRHGTEIATKVQDTRLKWFGHVIRREDHYVEHYVGRRAMEMKVQGRRKRGRHKRRWLDKERMVSKRRDCPGGGSVGQPTTMLLGGVCHRTSTPPHTSGNDEEGEEMQRPHNEDSEDALQSWSEMKEEG